MTTVLDRMLNLATTHPVDATIGDARAFFGDVHKHLMLLVEDGFLRGTVTRDDLETTLPDTRPALDVARLEGRTVPPDADAEVVRRELGSSGMRRIAVVDADLRLLGLLCLKKHQRGFCSDENVADRAAERQAAGYFAGRDEA